MDAWSIRCTSCNTVLLYALFAGIATLALYEGYTSLIIVVPCKSTFVLKINEIYNHVIQGEKDKALAVLSKIYDPIRLEDEIDNLADAAEQDLTRRKASLWDVFGNKERRLAFFVGGGLQVSLNSV